MFESMAVDTSLLYGEKIQQLAREVGRSIDELIIECGGPKHLGGQVARVVRIDAPLNGCEPLCWKVLNADGDVLGKVVVDAVEGTLRVFSPAREAAKRGVMP
jgi:hypothetical protein